MDREKKALLREFKNNKGQITLIWNMQQPGQPKCLKDSESFRKKGNALYMQKDHNAETHKQIFNYYCQSIITAPNNSDQLAFAYGNRSAFLLHIKKYEDSIKDCNRALKITNSDAFKVKMLCRKAECLKKMNLPEFQNVLQEAESCRDQIDDNDKSMKSLTGMILKVKNLSITEEEKENKNVQSVQLDENFDGIRIEYNQKYGRHLVATKDYKPGDIILVENLFATAVRREYRYTNCHYCLKICWSGIPCKHCGWAIFCSEDCRHKAWKLHHDIECSLIPFLEFVDEHWGLYYTIVRAIIIGIKQAGSIAQMKVDLKSINESSADQCSKGFIKEGEYTKNRIESVYVLKTDRVHDDILKNSAECASKVVAQLAQHTQLFTNIDLTDVEKFVQNKDVIFLGSLITKLIVLRGLNDGSFSPKKLGACEKLIGLNRCIQDYCCAKGTCFMPISSLVSHSCFPNTSRCFLEDRKIILFAAQPIEKNSQVFDCYTPEFYCYPIAERNLTLRDKHHKFTCDCQACIESWPPILLLSTKQLKQHNYYITSALERKIHDECFHILKALDEKKIIFNKKDIKKLSEAIVQISELKKPSLLMACLDESLKRVFCHIYGLKLQRKLYDQCS